MIEKIEIYTMSSIIRTLISLILAIGFDEKNLSNLITSGIFTYRSSTI